MPKIINKKASQIEDPAQKKKKPTKKIIVSKEVTLKDKILDTAKQITWRAIKLVSAVLLLVVVFLFWNMGPSITSFKEIEDLFDVTSSKSALSVNLLAGELSGISGTVYLDGKVIGTTPVSVDQLKPGYHSVHIERNSDSPEFYEDFSRELEFYPSSRTVINWELGPKGYSAGTIVSSKKKIIPNAPASLYISSTQPEVEIFINNNSTGNTPVDLEEIEAEPKEILLRKSGFDSQKLTVNLKEGFTTIIEAQLMKKPLDVKR